MKKILCTILALAMLLPAMAVFSAHPEKAVNEVTVKLDPTLTSPFGAFQGWGTSLCWWAEKFGDVDEASRKAISEKIFDLDKGLGLNFVRYNIGGGDDPTHDHLGDGGEAVPGWMTPDGSFDENADPNQMNFLLDAVEMGANIVECFSNSPPYFMTVSGCASGNKNGGSSNISEDKLDDFADYLTGVVSIIQNKYGVKVDTLEPMNEPNTNYWSYGGRQEGCHISPAKQSILIRECARALKEKGLTNVAVAASDETNTGLFNDYIEQLDGDAVALLGRFNVHTYATWNMESLRDKVIKTGKPLFMTETDYNATLGIDAELMGPALWFSKKITGDIKGLQCVAWTVWQAVEVYSPGRESPGGFWGLTQYDRESDTLYLSKKYYAYGQYSKFIRPGDYIIGTDSDNVLAAHDPESGKIVIVVTNADETDAKYTFDLSSFGAVGSDIKAYRTGIEQSLEEIPSPALSGRNLTVDTPQNTVTTYVITGANGGEAVRISAENGEKCARVGESIRMTANAAVQWSIDGDAKIDSDGKITFESAGSFTVTGKSGDAYDNYEISAWDEGELINLISDCSRLPLCECLDMTGRVTQYKNAAYSAAKWVIQKRGDGYVITNYRTGKYLADNNGLLTSDEEFIWTLDEKNGSYSISHGDRYVDLYNWRTDEGAVVDMYSYTGSNNQYWSICPAPDDAAVEDVYKIGEEKLTGEAFATDPWNDDVAKENAFDGSFETFFDTREGDTGYVGLDLGEGAKAVTKVRYAPRSWYFWRMPGGKFQGADKLDGEWVDLGMIEHTPMNDRFTTLEFDNSHAYRYVRYYTPKGGCANISELEFYSKPYDISASSGEKINVDFYDATAAARLLVIVSRYAGGKLKSVGVAFDTVPDCGEAHLAVDKGGFDEAVISVYANGEKIYEGFIKK